MRIAKYVVIAFIVLLAGAQAIRPAKTNPAPTKPYEIGDANVESILRRSCFDCHSNETRWPWYSQVAPMSWQIVSHVNDGRRHMNFSDWNDEKAKKRLEEMCEEIEEGGMPLPGYVLLHRDAKLSPEDVSALCSWAGARLAVSGTP